MDWIFNVLVIVLGGSALVLGIKGFSEGGLPLTNSKKLRGRFARFIGSVCILLGVSWIIVGLWLGAGAPR